jgi:Carbohydrate esterase, sialic acid-specific acetylesterase
MSSIVPVVIFMGQSNTDGRSFLAEAPWLQDKTFEGIKIFDKPLVRNPADSSVNHTDNGQWVDFAYDKCMVCSPQGTNSFGPELPFAVAWREKHGRPLYIIKCTIGGTPLQSNGGGADTDWSNGTSQIWDIALNYITIPALKSLALQNLTPVCIGIFWGQGESDATASLSSSYATALTTHITNRLRGQIGFPSARVMLMHLSEYSDLDSNWLAVKSAQVSVASTLSNVVLIRTDGSGSLAPFGRYDASTGAGAIHLNAHGLTSLGNAVFGAIDHGGAPYESQSVVLDPKASHTRTGTPLDTTKFVQDYFGTATESFNFATCTIDYNGTKIPAYAWTKTGPRVGTDTKVKDARVRLAELDNSGDVEVVFAMRWTQLNTYSRPGIWLRAKTNVSDGTNNNAYSQGYFFYCSMTAGGSLDIKLQKASGVVNTFAMLGGGSTWSVPSPYPTLVWGATRWYKVSMVGSAAKFSESLDGSTWSTVFSLTDTEFATGDVYISDWNVQGAKASAASAPYTLAYSYPMIMARKL